MDLTNQTLNTCECRDRYILHMRKPAIFLQHQSHPSSCIYSMYKTHIVQCILSSFRQLLHTSSSCLIPSIIGNRYIIQYDHLSLLNSIIYSFTTKLGNHKYLLSKINKNVSHLIIWKQSSCSVAFKVHIKTSAKKRLHEMTKE